MFLRCTTNCCGIWQSCSSFFMSFVIGLRITGAFRTTAYCYCPDIHQVHRYSWAVAVQLSVKVFTYLLLNFFLCADFGENFLRKTKSQGYKESGILRTEDEKRIQEGKKPQRFLRERRFCNTAGSNKKSAGVGAVYVEFAAVFAYRTSGTFDSLLSQFIGDFLIGELRVIL